MKKYLVILVMLLFSFYVIAQDFVFNSKDLNGNTITNDVFKNSKITMINVWGTFCSPCIREMPDLAKLNKTYKKEDFQVIGIVIDVLDQNGILISKKINEAKTIVNSTGADYIHVIPNLNLMITALNNVQAIPATFFVDSNGKIIDQMILGAKSFKQWNSIVDSYLK